MLETFTPTEVFCSYAHEDEALLRKVEKHLSLLKRQGLVSLWHDRLISPGSDWAIAIDTHLETASVILLFISADFLASDYCYGIEMQYALQRHQNNQARVIPVLLRPVDWKGSPFAHLQALPTNAKPITTWHNKDAAFANVVAGIRQTIEEVVSFSASPSLSPLPSIWYVPYSRNPFFTGRQDLLEELRDRLTTVKTTALTQRQAISGLGGVGKTQIALEYVYQYRRSYRFIFWIRAAERETLISDFVTIAGLLHLPEKDESDQNQVVIAVKQWFATHQDWLLVLDNADDVAMVSAFLPTDGPGHLLITSRAQTLGLIAQQLNVDTMGMMEGTLFLLRRTRCIAQDAFLDQATDEQLAGAEAIIIAMDFLPLALDQAGAYIDEVGCDFSTYWQLYQANRKKLLQRRSQLPVDHPEPVATTWSLSFEKVEQANPAAAHLLRLCAFLEPDFIPEELISEGCVHLGSVLRRAAKHPLALNDAIEELLKFSLIKRHAATKTISIHRLVQAVLKDTLKRGLQRRWAERAVLATYTVFPKEAEKETGLYRQRYLSQAQECTALIQEYSITLVEALHLLNRTGNYLSRHALYKQAEALYLRALTIGEQSLDPDDPNTANPLINLAILYSDQGKYGEAESFYLRALHIWEQCFGPEHPDIALPLNELAILYSDQGKYVEAEPLYLRALHIREQNPDIAQLDVASSFQSLANFYRKQGKYIEAESLYQRALHIREQHLGSEHPDIAALLHNLALVHSDQGKYVEAEPLYQRALHIWEQRLGPEHPDVALPVSSLANLYDDQGKYAEAEALYQRALHIREQYLGPEHPDVASSLYNLANLYSNQGKYAEAESLYLRALDTWEQCLGPEHPDVAYPLIGLADLYSDQGNYAEAEPLYLRALYIREQRLGPEQLAVANPVLGLANLYDMQGKYAEAEPLYQRVLHIREQHLGPGHPDVAHSLGSLALLYSHQGKFVESQSLYHRALSTLEQVLGSEHLDLAGLLNNLALLYSDQGNYEQAELFCQRALHIREQHLGSEHPDTANSLGTLAFLYSNQGKYEQAKPLYQSALSILTQCLGPQHPDTAVVRYDIAVFQEAQGQKDEAEASYKSALAVQEQILGLSHPKTNETRNRYLRLLQERSSIDETLS